MDTNKPVYQEDLDSATLAACDAIVASFESKDISIDQDALYEQLTGFMTELFNYPDYRNHN